MPKSSYREIYIILGRVFGLPYCTLTLVRCSRLRAYHVYVNHDYELKCQIHILLDAHQYISYNHEVHHSCAVTMFPSNGDVNIGPHQVTHYILFLLEESYHHLSMSGVMQLSAYGHMFVGCLCENDCCWC